MWNYRVRLELGDLPDGRSGVGAGAVHEPAVGSGESTNPGRSRRQITQSVGIVVACLSHCRVVALLFERVAVSNFTRNRTRLLLSSEDRADETRGADD
jgi:hypothetical protein